MENELKGKVIMITGAAQGIANAVCRGCAEEGATLIMADINEPKLKDAVSELRALGFPCEACVMDITKQDMVEAGVQMAVDHYGHLDGLVHCAGISDKTLFLDSTAEWFDKLMHIDLYSTYYLGLAAAKVMKAQGHGAIVNFASIAAFSGGGLMGTSLYAAAKGGVVSLSRGMARELAPYGIRVNVIAPASIDTPMTLVGRDPESYAASIKKIPLGRRGTPGDLIRPVIMLLSDGAGFITGQVVHVNGGAYFC